MTAGDLRSAGYVVVEAGNAGEALAILKSGTPVDLVVTDIQMPGSIDGIELGIVVRSLWPSVKVVTLSSHSSKWFDSKLSDAYIEKPYDREHLLACIGNLLKKEP